VEDAVKVELRSISQRKGVTQQYLVDEALRLYVLADAASRNDAELAPLISRLIQDQHRTLGKGVRSLLVRLGYEVIRMQYVLYEFMTQAGIPGSKVATWREEGWRFAVKEFRQKPDELDESAGGETGR
jgi:hypothetical protein